jgi:hypothetical protein
MKNKIYLKLILCIIIISLIPQITAGGDNKETYELDWYAISAEELEICKTDGGLTNSGIIGSTSSGTTYISQTTLTLQGLKTIVEEEENGNSTIFEIAWFFRPFQSQEAYKIILIGKDIKNKIIYEGSSMPSRGDANYYAEESKILYTHVKIEYDSGTLTVPIVKK